MRNFKDEQGVFYMWLIALIPIILGTFSFQYFTTSRTLVLSQLKAAVDSASLAGARTFCSRRDCYADSVIAAIRTLNYYSAQGGNTTNFLVVNESDAPTLSSGVPTWTYSSENLIVTIERGWWTQLDPVGSPGEYSFESMEDTWQDSNPGIPAHVAANAIRVSVKRTGLTGFLDILGTFKGDVKQTATALAGPMGTVPVAPFAIPVCALTDASGEFQPWEVCKGDRIITESDRYLPSGITTTQSFGLSCAEIQKYIDSQFYVASSLPFPDSDAGQYIDGGLVDWYTEVLTWASFGYSNRSNCDTQEQTRLTNPSINYGTRPSFFYGTCSEDSYECNVTRQLNTSFKSQNETYGNELFAKGWANYAYENLADHYGVVGTNVSTITNESGIYVKLAGTNELTAQLGDPFYIIGNGLTAYSTGSLIWDIISEYTSTTSVYKSYLEDPEDTDIGKLENVFGKVTLATNLPIATQETYFDNSVFTRSAAYNLNIPISSPSEPTYPQNNFTTGSVDYNLAPRTNPNDTYNPFVVTNRSILSSAGNNITEASPGLARDMFTSGLCRSQRMELGCTGGGTFEEISTGPSIGNCTVNLNSLISNYSSWATADKDKLDDHLGNAIELSMRPNPLFSSPGSGRKEKVWQIQVPVIASRSGSPCEGISISGSPTSVETVLNTSNDHIIVGFVNLNIFDVDIGSLSDPRAPFPQQQSGSYSTLYTGNDGLPYGAYYLAGASSEYENKALPGDLTMPFIPSGIEPDGTYDSPTLTGPNPWYFQVNNVPQNCNMVRSRVTCDTNFVPSSQNEGYREARLVE